MGKIKKIESMKAIIIATILLATLSIASAETAWNKATLAECDSDLTTYKILNPSGMLCGSTLSTFSIAWPGYYNFYRFKHDLAAKNGCNYNSTWHTFVTGI